MMKANHALLLVPALLLYGCGRTCDFPLMDTGAFGLEEDVRDISFSLAPDVAQAGEVFITALVADADSADVDYSRIEDLVFYGEVQVCTMQARGDELLVSIGVAGDAPSREIDLVVVMDDGETFFVEAALTILGGDSSSGGGTADGAMCAG